MLDMWGIKLVMALAIVNLVFLFSEVSFNVFGVMLGFE